MKSRLARPVRPAVPSRPRCTLAALGLAALAILAGAASPALAQGLNPDLSVIGNGRAFVSSQDGSLDRKDGKLQLELESVEFALQGYLNPFSRADIFAAYTEGEGFKVEEAYATILRGLPGKMQLRAGRFRVDFGKLNLLHPHAYSFLDTPLAHQQFLGAEGLIDVGINLNAQFPVGTVVVTPSFNLLKGDFQNELLDMPGGTPAEERFTALETALATSQRLGIYIPTGDYAGFEIGLNALQGKAAAAGSEFDVNLAGTPTHVALERDLDKKLLGVDVKYRWAPDKKRSLTLQAEWIENREEFLDLSDPSFSSATERTSSGFWAMADYQFGQRWNVGAYYDRAEEAAAPEIRNTRVGAFAGFRVMEESLLFRAMLRRTDSSLAGAAPVNEAIVQMVFSLGPHRPHWF